jgi:cytochrome oxidase Cu insertion factor (SCO1/SenC/PrrC family)
MAFAAALALMSAVACGGETNGSPDTIVSQGSTATTETATTTDSSAATTDVAPPPSIPIGHSVGMLAPDFTVDTVGGESFTLSEATAAGSPVLLYFFATW